MSVTIKQGLLETGLISVAEYDIHIRNIYTLASTSVAGGTLASGLIYITTVN